jgi:hypothetical protein
MAPRQPRQLANTTTLATVGPRRITQLQYLSQLFSPTSENPQNANFVEFYKGEVRRIPIPRTPVNRSTAPPLGNIFIAAGCRRSRGLHGAKPKGSSGRRPTVP